MPFFRSKWREGGELKILFHSVADKSAPPCVGDYEQVKRTDLEIGAPFTPPARR